MKAVLDVINQLQKVIEEQLDYSNFSVELDYPDSDRCKKETSIFIVPNSGVLENLTTGSDECAMDLSIYIICKRQTSEKLMQNVFSCFEALYKLLRGNPTLDGVVADSFINSYEYYPSTETTSEKAIECQLSVLFEKDF